MTSSLAAVLEHMTRQLLNPGDWILIKVRKRGLVVGVIILDVCIKTIHSLAVAIPLKGLRGWEL